MSRQDDEVEAQPAACTAEPHAAEIPRMIDNPLVLDAETAGDLARAQCEIERSGPTIDLTPTREVDGSAP
jgi:hypothetical protein